MSRQINLTRGGMDSLSGGKSESVFSKLSSNARSFLSMKTLLYLIAGVLFIMLGGYYYYYYIRPKVTATFKPNNELMTSNSGSKEAELLFFYADWCPHCKTAKPIWNEIKSEYENKSVNGYNIVFTEVNCTTESPDVEKLMDQYKVEGFPTIKLLKDGQVIEYDAKPSRDTLNQFLTTVL
jgi:thiol-disulfide isomerase/thioredoxin